MVGVSPVAFTAALSPVAAVLAEATASVVVLPDFTASVSVEPDDVDAASAEDSAAAEVDDVPELPDVEADVDVLPEPQAVMETAIAAARSEQTTFFFISFSSFYIFIPAYAETIL